MSGTCDCGWTSVSYRVRTMPVLSTRNELKFLHHRQEEQMRSRQGAVGSGDGGW